MSQNYPNPFNPITAIKYTLAQSEKVELSVYNVLGQKVKTLVNKKQNAGLHIATWDGTNEQGVRLASGIYFYKLKTPNFTRTMKMIMLK